MHAANAVRNAARVAAATMSVGILTALSFVGLGLLLFFLGPPGIVVAALAAPTLALSALRLLWRSAADTMSHYGTYGVAAVLVGLVGARLYGQPLFSADAIEWPPFMAAWALATACAATLSGSHRHKVPSIGVSAR